MKNIIGVIIALILIVISLLAAFFLWENSPSERLRVEHEDDDHSHYHSHADHDHNRDAFTTLSDKQILWGQITWRSLF